VKWGRRPVGSKANPAPRRCPTVVTCIVRKLANRPLSRASSGWSTTANTEIPSVVTGLCADTGSATSGHLQVWYCATTDAQAWVAQPDGTVRVGRDCLAATGGDARLDRCDGSAAQPWRVGPDGTVVHQASGDCLADPGDNAVVATRLITEPCRSTAGQLWHIE
jgi:hypothetical protein